MLISSVRPSSTSPFTTSLAFLSWRTLSSLTGSRGASTFRGAIFLSTLICYHLCCLTSTYVVKYSRRIPNMEVDVDMLLELRINQGLSQRRLAELAGVSNTSVWKIEQGGGANPATLKKLADVLGVRPTDLLKERR